MCAPAVGAVISGVSAVGGMMNQQSQANAQYQAAKNQRQAIINQQRSKLTLDTARFHRKQADRKRADLSAVRSAEQAYLDNQNVYNDKVKSYLSTRQGDMIKSLSAGGKLGARGAAGGSAVMMQVANKAALGRDGAMALANLRSASTKLITSNRNIQEKLQGEFESNFSQIGDKPVQGFEPPEVAKPAGPNPLSIAAAIGGVALDGYNAMQSAKTLPDGTTMDQAGGGGMNWQNMTFNKFGNLDTGINFGG